MITSDADLTGVAAAVRWVDPKEAASSAGVSVAAVWRWCRARVIRARRLPGARGRIRVALDREGFPVEVETARRSARRSRRR